MVRQPSESSAAVLNFDSGILSIDGLLRNEDVMRIGTAGQATIRAGSLENVGAILGRGVIDAPTVNQGNMSFSGDSSFNEDFVNNGTGLLVVSGGSSLTFYEDVMNLSGGEIRVSAGCTVTYFGDVSGSGDFTGTGTSYTEGDMRPGSSPGAMNFEGDVVFGSRASLVVEIAGLVPGDNYDQLNVGGQVTLDGTLSVSLVRFRPSEGDEFVVLTHGSRAGDFDNYEGLYLGMGLNLDVVETAESLTLVADQWIPGDATFEDKVDGGDLAIWQRNYDPIGINAASNWWGMGDWNDDGRIDGGDLALWQRNYDPLGPTGAGLSEVPEPSTLLLIGTGALAIIGWIRRRRIR